MGGFSIASVVLSYFLTAGGMLAGSLLMAKLHTSSEAVALLCWAVGSFVGGFFAARASRGSTIIEPAIGAVLVVLTVVATAAGSDTGKVMWHMGDSGLGKVLAEITAALVVGAAAGAFVSEKMFGDSTESSVPWILYIALSTFGACILAFVIVAAALHRNTSEGTAGAAVFAAIGLGCILAGVSSGAQARTRPLLAALFGGTIGVFGFFMLLYKLLPTGKETGKVGELMAGFAILAFGGGIVTLLGALVGWGAVGKRPS